MAKRFSTVESYKIKQAVFLVILVLIITSVYLIFSQKDLIGFLLIVLAGMFVLGFVLWRYDFLLTLKEYERAVIYRLGKANRVGGPGWTFLMPVIESFKIVDLRTKTIDIPAQDVITSDQVVLRIDAIIYLFVKKDSDSVMKSVIEIDDYEKAAELFVKSSIRDVAGKMTVMEIVSNIHKLNEEVKKNVAPIAEEWGVSIESIEISDIKLPENIAAAMHEEKAAEQLKQARMQSAEAHKAEIEAVRSAAENLSNKALSYYYIRAMEKLGEGKSTKFFFPMELTKLAEAIGNRVEGKQSGDIEMLFEKYKPAINALLAQGQKPKKKGKKK